MRKNQDRILCRKLTGWDKVESPYNVRMPKKNPKQTNPKKETLMKRAMFINITEHGAILSCAGQLWRRQSKSTLFRDRQSFLP